MMGKISIQNNDEVTGYIFQPVNISSPWKQKIIFIRQHSTRSCIEGTFKTNPLCTKSNTNLLHYHGIVKIKLSSDVQIQNALWSGSNREISSSIMHFNDLAFINKTRIDWVRILPNPNFAARGLSNCTETDKVVNKLQS